MNKKFDAKLVLAALGIALVILGVARGIEYAIDLKYNMSGPTVNQNLVVSLDAEGKQIITPASYDWSSQGVIITNGTVLDIYVTNNGNVPLTVQILPEGQTSCNVTYAPLAFVLNSTAVQDVSMTFDLVVSASTATWHFDVAAN